MARHSMFFLLKAVKLLAMDNELHVDSNQMNLLVTYSYSGVLRCSNSEVVCVGGVSALLPLLALLCVTALLPQLALRCVCVSALLSQLALRCVSALLPQLALRCVSALLSQLALRCVYTSKCGVCRCVRVSALLPHLSPRGRCLKAAEIRFCLNLRETDYHSHSDSHCRNPSRSTLNTPRRVPLTPTTPMCPTHSHYSNCVPLIPTPPLRVPLHSNYAPPCPTHSHYAPPCPTHSHYAPPCPTTLRLAVSILHSH